MRRLFAVLLLALMVISGVFAGAESEPGADEQITIRMMMYANPNYEDGISAVLDRYTELNPNVEFEFTTTPTSQYQAELMARTAANDVDMYGSAALDRPVLPYMVGDIVPANEIQLAASGLLAPLDDVQGVDRVMEGIRPWSQYEGTTYGVIMNSTIMSGMFVNIDLLASYGLEVPTTWEELIEVAETFKADGRPTFSTGGAASWAVGMMLAGFEGPIIQDTDGIDSILDYHRSWWETGNGPDNPIAREALGKYHELLQNYYEPGFQSLDYNPHISRFVEQHVPILPDGVWQTAAIRALDPEFEFTYVPIPASSNPLHNATFYGKADLTWYVLENSPNKDVVKDVLEFMLLPENYRLWVETAGVIPSIEGTDVSDPVIQSVVNTPLLTAHERIRKAPEGVTGSSQHAVASALTPVGSFETVEELVTTAGQDWRAALGK